VWNPSDIHDPAIQQKVLAHMQAAERGFRRADAALETGAVAGIFQRLKLTSLGQVDNLKTLLEIVIALEDRAAHSQE